MNTPYQGKHRTARRVDYSQTRIVASEATTASMLPYGGALYVSLYDEASGDSLGIDFGPRSQDVLRRAVTP